MLRQAAPLPPGGPNVIPIRPGALAGYAYPAEETRRAADERETVELTNDERDAFREIARALGARLPLRSEEKAPEPPRARDLIDLLEAGAPEARPRRAHRRWRIARPAADRRDGVARRRAALSQSDDAASRRLRRPRPASRRGWADAHVSRPRRSDHGRGERRRRDAARHCGRRTRRGGRACADDLLGRRASDADRAEARAGGRAPSGIARARERRESARGRRARSRGDAGSGDRRRDRPRRGRPHRYDESRRADAVRLRIERRRWRELSVAVRAAEPERSDREVRGDQAGGRPALRLARRSPSAATGAANRSR